jgi:glutamate-1-semialdehyde 2,1-aminomutase
VLYEDRYVYVMRKDHPRAGEPVTLDSFCEIPQVFLGYGTSMLDDLIDETLAQGRPPAAGADRRHQLRPDRHQLQHSDHAAVLGGRVAREFADQLHIQPLPFELPATSRSCAGTGTKPLPTTVPFDFVVLPYNDAQTAREQIEMHGADIAAVLVEPMQGASGCIPGRLDFLQALRESATRVGALLVFDEVMTSRLAPHGLANQLGLRSDLTTLGKYIGGGMSFGAFGGRADVMALFDPRTGSLAHSGTFNNNVMTMAAGYAGLTRLFPPEAAGALAARGESMRARLNALCEEKGVALQFTGLGSLMNAHFLSGEVVRSEDLAGVDGRLRQLLFFHLLGQGIYASPRGFVVLSLPVTDADIDRFVAAIDSFIGMYGALLPRR